jgi:hypothetical protein
MTDTTTYVHHAIACAPRAWAQAGRAIAALDWAGQGGLLYGLWRSQIGRPRDELTALTAWADAGAADRAAALIGTVAEVRTAHSLQLRATLRPLEPVPPRRQGNYAFRWFELAEAHWPEFESLCAAAWPGFEAAYDSQVVGLWRGTADAPGRVRSLLLTRRPDLAMWERSKQPQGEAEGEVRRQLSRRYDLCDDTWVHTTTLITAEDHPDEVRWT